MAETTARSDGDGDGTSSLILRLGQEQGKAMAGLGVLMRGDPALLARGDEACVRGHCARKGHGEAERGMCV